MTWVSMYPPQWQNTTLHHSGLPNWPMLQGQDCVPPHPTCSASHGNRCHTLQDSGVTPHRARVITDFLPPALWIWLPSIFGQRVAKNTPPLLMCTSSPVSCSRCGRVNLSQLCVLNRWTLRSASASLPLQGSFEGLLPFFFFFFFFQFLYKPKQCYSDDYNYNL